MENTELQTLAKENRVDFWTRLGAYLIDVLFIIIAGVIIGLAIGDLLAPVLFGGQMSNMEDQFSQMGRINPDFNELPFDLIGMMNKMMSIAAGTTIAGIVLLILEGALGQSIGKMLLKIKNTDVYGNQAAPQVLWTRALLKYGSSVLGIIGGMTGLMIISTLGSIWGLVIFVGYFLVFMDNRQAIHDMIAKTIVCRLKK
ncbi:MAG: RDD family protein [Vicingaceae bacterium]|nr:RDD family protein [Vicingaceae bacterium]